MPYSTTVTVPAGTMTPLTNGDTTDFTFLVSDAPLPVFLFGGVGSAEPDTPAGLEGGFPFAEGSGLQNIDPATFLPGTPGATRFWAYCRQDALVVVSHA